MFTRPTSDIQSGFYKISNFYYLACMDSLSSTSDSDSGITFLLNGNQKYDCNSHINTTVPIFDGYSYF